MNPYTAPSSSEDEDRTDPGFQVILPLAPKARITHAALLFAGGAGLVIWNFESLVRIGDVFRTSIIGPVLMMISALATYFGSIRQERFLRSRAIVRDGSALAAGWANPRSWWIPKRGYLFLTRQNLLIQLRGGERVIPLREIEQIRIGRRWGMEQDAIEVLTVHGTTERIGVYKPNAWLLAIDAARPVEIRPMR